MKVKWPGVLAASFWVGLSASPAPTWATPAPQDGPWRIDTWSGWPQTSGDRDIYGPSSQAITSEALGYFAVTQGPDDTLYAILGHVWTDFRIVAIKNGRIIPFAGTGISGFRDGPAHQAMFSLERAHYNNRWSLACDSKGVLYFSDIGNRRVRRVLKKADGQWYMETAAGGGTRVLAVGESAPANQVSLGTYVAKFALASDDLLWIIGPGQLYKFVPSTGIATRFSLSPHGNGTDIDGDGKGNAYFVYELNAADCFYIRISPDGSLTKIAGVDGSTSGLMYAGPRDKAWFHTTTGLVAPRDGYLYVNGGDSIFPRRFTGAGSEPVEFILKDGTWTQPLGVATSEGPGLRVSEPLGYDNHGGIYASGRRLSRQTDALPPEPPLYVAPSGTGTGLTGEYFEGVNFNTLKLKRIDPQINFNWVAAAPATTMPADSFSVRWTGQLEPRYSGEYTFFASADEGVRLWINGQLLINAWPSPWPPPEFKGSISLQGGQKVDIKVEYYESRYDAQIKVSWMSAGQPKEIIPQSQLYPEIPPNTPPTITTQPAAVTVTVGQTATFTVGASGSAPLSYQWQKNGANIAGATSSSYTTPATTNADSGASFRAVVTNAYGTVTSAAATLTVSAPTAPAITTQPAAVTVTAGQTATFTVSALGTAPLSYQWQKNGANIAGATSASYTTPATTTADSGSTYRAVVTNGQGSATSSPATLTVNPAPAPVPPPWQNQDVGSVGVGGNATFGTGTFTVKASGVDIWGNADSFHFVYQSLSGDGQIVARVATEQNTNEWAKAGVMIRESLASGSTHAAMVLTPSHGARFQWRPTTGGASSDLPGPNVTAPYWVRLVRSGNAIAGSVSSNGTTWTVVTTQTVPMGASVYVGLALTSGNNGALNTSTFDSVSVTTGGAPVAPSITMQPANKTVTVGQTATFSVTATGTAPLSYQWQRNGADIAGATSSSYTTPAVAAGDDGSTYRVRVTNAAGSVTSASATLTVTAAPANPDSDNDGLPDAWEQEHFGGLGQGPGGDADGDGATNLQEQQGGTDPMDPGSRPAGAGLPAPWVHQDVGAVGLAGTATYAGSTFTVDGAGADIWGTADGFHFSYQPWNGDVEIMARIASQENTDAWAKAGPMIREALTAGSRHAIAAITPGSGAMLQWRAGTGGASASSASSAATSPRWLRLARSGDVFTASISADGVSWTVLGAQSIAMGANVYVGLAVSSHTTASLNTSAFDSVLVKAGTSTPPPGAASGRDNSKGGTCGIGTATFFWPSPFPLILAGLALTALVRKR